MSRPKCEPLDGACPSPAVWKTREPGDHLERNWVFSCGRHLNQVAGDQAFDSGMRLDLVRLKADG